MSKEMLADRVSQILHNIHNWDYGIDDVEQELKILLKDLRGKNVTRD